MRTFNEIWSSDPHFLVYLLEDLPHAAASDGVFAILAAGKVTAPEKVLYIGHSQLGGDIFGEIAKVLRADPTLRQRGATRVAVKRLKFTGSTAIFVMLLEDECQTLRQKFLLC